jgi:hypothetical protein
VPSIGTLQIPPHRLDRSLVGLAIPLAHRVRTRDGRLFDDAEEFEREVRIHS